MRQILPKLLNVILLWTLLGTAGCGAVRHIIHQPGDTGLISETTKAKVFMPDKDGNLIEGDTDIPPGTLIRIPKDRKEILDTLNAAGVKIVEPGK